MTSSASSPVVVSSTGQTLYDLITIGGLFNLTGSDNSPFDSPSGLPPAFLDPNYIPPKRNEMKIALGSTIGMVIATALVVTRIITTQRYRMTSVPFLEDILLLLSVLSAFVLIILSWITLTKYQAGWHVYDVHAKSLVTLYKLLMITDIIALWTYSITRISLLLSIRRLYSPMRTRMQTVCDVLITMKIMCCIGGVLALVFVSPKHPGAIFDLYTSGKYRARPMTVTIGLCATTLTLDCFVLLSPLPLIPMLKKLSWKRQVQMFCICSFGFLTVISSAARLWQFVALQDLVVKDLTWYFGNLEIVNNCEVILAIVTSCLPSAKVFFRWAYDKKAFPQGHIRDRRPNSEHYGDKGYQLSEIDSSASPDAMASFAVVAFVEEVEEPEDDNFYEYLEPSDSFFPSATGLSPPPCRAMLDGTAA